MSAAAASAAERYTPSGPKKVAPVTHGAPVERTCAVADKEHDVGGECLVWLPPTTWQLAHLGVVGKEDDVRAAAAAAAERCTPKASTLSTVSRMPAVSSSVTGMPRSSTCTRLCWMLLIRSLVDNERI